MGDRVACPVHSSSAETDAGLHPATGGDGSLACSADMRLEALIACAGDRSRHGHGVKFQSRRVIAEGHWDTVGTRYMPVSIDPAFRVCCLTQRWQGLTSLKHRKTAEYRF